MYKFFGAVGIKRLFVVMITGLMLSNIALAQHTTDDLNLDENVTPWFLEAIGIEQTKLISGSYHQIQRGSSITHQFFKENGWTSTSIIYYGKEFHLSGAMYDLEFDAEIREKDEVFEDKGVKILVDRKSLLYLLGTTLDFSDGLNGKGFQFINPNASRTCGCGESFSV